MLAALCASAMAQPPASAPANAFAPRIPYGDKDGAAFLEAAQKGDDAKILTLLEKGIPIDIQDSGYGVTALQLAAGNRHVSTVKLLLEHGSDVHIKTYRGTNGAAALAAAEAGIFYVPSDGSSTSLSAAFGQLDSQTWRKKHPRNWQKDREYINKAIDQWLQPDERIIRILLGYGVDVNDESGTAHTLLGDAAFGCNSSIIRLLISHGSNVNVQDRDGETALMMAAMWPGSSDKVSLLLKSGANPLLRDKSGKTALDYALQNHDTNIRHLLKQAIAKQPPSHFSPAM